MHVRRVVRDDDRPLRSLAPSKRDSNRHALRAAAETCERDTCAITTWRDPVYKRNRLRDENRSLSSFATPCRASSNMRCQSRRVVFVIRSGGVTSLGIARLLLLFPRSDRSRERQVVLQTKCYFSDVTEEAGSETGRAMFFEKPVGAAITASEIDGFARPIGKKGGSEQREPRRAIPASFVRTYVDPQHPRIISTAVLRRRSCYSTTVLRESLAGCARARSAVGYRRGAARTFFLVVVVVVCLSLLPPVVRSRRAVRARSARSLVRDVSDSPSRRKHQTWPSYGYTLVECVPG